MIPTQTSSCFGSCSASDASLIQMKATPPPTPACTMSKQQRDTDWDCIYECNICGEVTFGPSEDDMPPPPFPDGSRRCNGRGTGCTGRMRFKSPTVSEQQTHPRIGSGLSGANSTSVTNVPALTATSAATPRTQQKGNPSSAAQTVAAKRPENVHPDVAALAYDVHGNALATLPTEWPIARPTFASRTERIQRIELRRAFVWAIQRQQQTHETAVLPACTWCGMPTGGWCDMCILTPAKAVCSQCEGTTVTVLASCRDCSATPPAGM